MKGFPAVLRPLSRLLFVLVFGASLGASIDGCDVNPYCFDCVDGRLDAGRADANDSSTSDAGDANRADSNTVDTNPFDAWRPDGCAVGAPEVCNNFDDNCNGMIDEGVDTTHDIDNCGSCGHRCTYDHAFSECTASTCSMGTCLAGYYDIDGMDSNGCEYRCLPTGTTEVCDRRDNNCDGNIDEGFVFASDPANCGICGRVCNLAHTTSTCTAGVCTIGACAMGFVDADGVAANGCEYSCTPSSSGVETCNRIDDDCDGMIDEDLTAGGSCGSSTGICMPGTLTCVGGAMTCTGGVSAGVESCNNMDDDCDGTVDDGNPGGGGSCGLSVGACMPGTEMCSGGTLACMGDVGPALETCNMVDDDCNGTVDDGYDLTSDIRNCGMCGRTCSYPNAVAQCTTGSCSILACAGGFVNLDGMAANGCEYMCTRTSMTESCNGVDDNCNGMIDEGVTAPPTLCRTAGVCMSSTATCMGSMGFVCSYTTNPNYQTTETRCDGMDNDCDGLVDEPFPLLGTACNNGMMGGCNRPGVYVCNGISAIMCNAPAGTPAAETCNGVDDNCNGMIDDGSAPRGTWTQIRPVGGTGATDFWIQSYEASRPGATAMSQGTFSNMACSVTGVLPWTSVTPAEAAAACAATGGSLCTEAQWQRACNSSAGTACTWSESAACTTYSSTACNGLDYDTNMSMAGNQDGLISTGTLATCRVPFTIGGTTGQVYDMSGNAQEWTAPRSAGVNPIRGGSYNDISGGMTCGFSFEVGGNTIRLPNTGFRCCRTSAP